MDRRTLRAAMDESLDAMTMSEDDPVRFLLDLQTGNVASRCSPDVFGDLGQDEDDFDNPPVDRSATSDLEGIRIGAA